MKKKMKQKDFNHVVNMFASAVWLGEIIYLF